jgi:hypothetical protein
VPESPRHPGDQSYDGLLVQADLPQGWYLPDRFPSGGEDDPSAQIDAIIGYDDQALGERDRRAQRESEQNETIDGRWRYIEHTATATRVLIRLQRQIYAVPEEVRITGVLYMPWRPGDPVTSQDLRNLPTARIEAAINERLFAMKRTQTIAGGKIVLPSGRKVSERDLLKPIGDPKRTPDFYELVALQYGRLSARGDVNPAMTMADINGVAHPTAQGWLVRARSRGLLPPGPRGRRS